MDSDVCVRTLHIMKAVITLGPGTCQIYDNHNITNVARSYLLFYIFHNFNILNILVHGNVFPDCQYWHLYSSVCDTPWKGTLAPQHVAVFKTYAQFAILLCALVCEVIILPDVHNKHPRISIK
jgi:hypothetical protein